MTAKPLVIEVGLNEGTTKEENPSVPYSPKEIAEDILAVAEAGASVVHFHARDPKTGGHRLGDTELYREAMTRVRKAGCDIHMYPTYPPTANDFNERFRHVVDLAAVPDLMKMGPLDMGSMNLIQCIDGKFTETSFMPLEMSVYSNPFLHLREMLAFFVEHDMVPSLAVFEPGWLRTVAGFISEGAIKRVPIVKFFFSEEWVWGPLPDREGIESYVHMIKALGLDDSLEWLSCPYGITNSDVFDSVIDSAIELGGHVRVGVGDLATLSGGRSNADLVLDVVGRAKAAERPVATPRDVLTLCHSIS